MEYTSAQMEEIEKGDMYADSMGLHIRLDAKTIRGYLTLRKIGEAAKRPVSTFGGAFENQAYIWITISLTKIVKTHGFDNSPSKKRKLSNRS